MEDGAPNESGFGAGAGAGILAGGGNGGDGECPDIEGLPLLPDLLDLFLSSTVVQPSSWSMDDAGDDGVEDVVVVDAGNDGVDGDGVGDGDGVDDGAGGDGVGDADGVVVMPGGVVVCAVVVTGPLDLNLCDLGALSPFTTPTYVRLRPPSLTSSTCACTRGDVVCW